MDRLLNRSSTTIFFKIKSLFYILHMSFDHVFYDNKSATTKTTIKLRMILAGLRRVSNQRYPSRHFLDFPSHSCVALIPAFCFSLLFGLFWIPCRSTTRYLRPSPGLLCPDRRLWGTERGALRRMRLRTRCSGPGR